MRKSMILMMMADYSVDEEEVNTIATMYYQLTGKQLSAAEIQAEVKKATSGIVEVIGYLSKMAPMLDDAAKKLVIQAAFKVAAADSHIDNLETNLLMAYGTARQMKGDEVISITEAMMADVKSKAQSG